VSLEFMSSCGRSLGRSGAGKLDGRPRSNSPLARVALLRFFLAAAQNGPEGLVRDLNVVDRRWPTFLFVYTGVLAFAVYQGGRALGFA